MKALTLTQPWATLVAIGAKRIETRSWSTGYEGSLAIHAAKGFPEDARMDCIGGAIQDALDAAGFDEGNLPRGVIVATARLVRVLPIYSFATIRTQVREYCGVHINSDEEAFGDYSPRRFAWVFTDIVRIEPPIAAKGALGLWEWNPGSEVIVPEPTARQRRLI